MMKNVDQKESREFDIFFFYQAVFSSSSLEEVILCHTIPSCALNIYVFPRLPWAAMPRNKGTGRSQKIST